MDPTDNHEELLTDIAFQLQVAIKTSGSYPEKHPITRRVINSSYEALTERLKEQPIVSIGVFGDKLLVDDIHVDTKNTFSSDLAKRLRQRAVDSVTFCRGISFKDFRVFLVAMKERPDRLLREGGMNSIFLRHGVKTMRLNEVKYGAIREGTKQLDDDNIISFLRGDSDSSGTHGQRTSEVLSNEPDRISALIMQLTGHTDMTEDRDGYPARAKATVELVKRVATELLGREHVNWEAFKEYMTCILSDWGQEILVHMARTLNTVEGEKEEMIDGLARELFYNAVSGIDIKDYPHNGKIDRQNIEGLVVPEQRRKKKSTSLEEELRGPGIPEKGAETPKEKSDISSRDSKEEVVEPLNKSLSEANSEELRKILEDFGKGLENTSWKIRKKVAESFKEITSVLSSLNKLNESFQLISETLTTRLRDEDHVDIYFLLSENLHKVCALEKSPNTYFRDETIAYRLFEAEQLSKTQTQQALMARKNNGKSLQFNLGAMSYVDEPVLVQVLAQNHRGCRTVCLSGVDQISKNVLESIPIKFVDRYLVLPFRLTSGNLYIAMTNPMNLEMLNDIRFISGYMPVPHLAAEYHLLNAIEKFYRIKTVDKEIFKAMENIGKELGIEVLEEEETPAVEDLRHLDAPVVKLVNLILKEAIIQKASDIHIEPYEKELRVRFRIDGTLTTLFNPLASFTSVLCSRIKIMAGLDISERRLPQDGSFKIKIDGKHVDFRVSTFRGNFGEKVVLRILDRSNLSLGINNLGLNRNDLDILSTAMHKSKGMILLTGPTGSGKTTTLYSILHDLNDGSRNICTAEDPIEYNLRGINQFQMNSRIGLNFARALRAFLRQDPDIIMVGEIRDLETAEVSIKAALTGHLVLSTLHTNSAPETIVRLLNIGIEPYLITSSVNLIIAQRLMRKVCMNCRLVVPPSDFHLKILEKYGFDVSGQELFRGEGCGQCNNSGYEGRSAIFEVMPMWDKIQQMIHKSSSSVSLAAYTKKLGFHSLPEQGFKGVIEGTTDLDEWIRVVT